MKLVKDIQFSELPEETRERVIEAAKIVQNGIREELGKDEYESFRHTDWAEDKIQEFNLWFQDGMGDARLYKNGNRYSCMIQISGHVHHVENDPNCETFRKLISKVFNKCKGECKKYQLKLVSEGECGDNFEGFDIWLDSTISKLLWEKYADKESKKVIEVKESTEFMLESSDTILLANFNELSLPLRQLIEDTNTAIYVATEKVFNKFSEYFNKEYMENTLNTIGGFNEYKSCIGDLSIWIENGQYVGFITLTPPISISNNVADNIMESVCNRLAENFDPQNPTKHMILTGDNSYCQFEMGLDESYAHMLYDKMNGNLIYEDTSFIAHKEFTESDMFFELTESTTDGKAEIDSLAKDLPGADANKGKKILNAISGVINKGILQKWASGWKEVHIRLTQNKSFMKKEVPIFAFTPPSDLNDQQFAQRFIRGHESFQAYLRRNPDIVINFNTQALATLKKGEDLYPVLHGAVQYYDGAIIKLAEKIQGAIINLPIDVKQIILNTDLYKLVGLSLEQLFIIEHVDFSNAKAMFEIPKKITDTAVSIIKEFPKKPISDRKEQKKILDEYKRLIVSYNEYGYTSSSYRGFLETLDRFMNGEYNSKLSSYMESWKYEQEDAMWIPSTKDPELKYMQEKFGVKKLKKIPADLVSYITIETEAIRDSNDKMMIASYCLAKLEIVEWYIELLEVGSKKYIVPHTLPYLNGVRTQLLACYDKIMKVRIVPASERPLLGEIRYPAGYEG